VCSAVVLQARPTQNELRPLLLIPGEWKKLAAGNFKDYRLKVFGQVENQVELSLADLRALGEKPQITLHHCIQGWSGIAAWGGLPLAELMKLVRPSPHVKAVVFYSFCRGSRVQHGRPGRPVLRQPLDQERTAPAKHYWRTK